jgi:hypothetical protein
MGKRVLLTLALALAAAPFIMSGVAGATPTPTPKPSPAPTLNVLSNNYFSNANTAGEPLGQVRIVNNSGSSLCANIYVTDPEQEMSECCACNLSDKSTRILSINSDLTANPGTGVVLANGSIAIVSSAGSCGDPATAKPKPELSAWATHPQAGDFLTEEEFTPVPLASAALADLQAECAALELIGSGHGICSCGTGD